MEEGGFGTELWRRLKIVVVDGLMIFGTAAAVATVACVVVHFFRLWRTGHYLLKAISSCPSFCEAAIWPSVILIAAVVFRQQLLDALKEVPSLIKNFNPNAKISNAAGDGEKAEAKSSSEEKGQKAQSSSCSKKTCNQTQFEEYALACLQSEVGATVRRRVNLFGSRRVRFDAVIVRDERITAIEVFPNGWSGDVVGRLRVIDDFHRYIGRPDQDHFDVIVCLPLDQQSRVEEFAAQREYLSYSLEYRFYPSDKNGAS